MSAREEILNIVGIYSAPDRDPREHAVTIAYHATPAGGTLKAGSDAEEVMKTRDYLNIKLASCNCEHIRRTKKE